jgi:hypothetical protein
VEVWQGYSMKARGFFLVLMACILTGCHTDNYTWRDWFLIAGYTGYDKVARTVKKHEYAAPGTRLDDFERRIKAIEHVTSLDSDFDVGGTSGTNGVVCYDYEGKRTVYYGRFIKEQSPLPKHPPALFDTDEIKDPLSLASKLKASADPISADLLSRFSDDGRKAIAGFPQSGPEAQALQGVLTKELNAVVVGPLIYDEHRFSGVRLRPMETNWMKLQPRSEQDAAVLRAALNRFLLEDAYPNVLARAPLRVDYRHWYVAIKY